MELSERWCAPLHAAHAHPHTVCVLPISPGRPRCARVSSCGAVCVSTPHTPRLGHHTCKLHVLREERPRPKEKPTHKYLSLSLSDFRHSANLKSASGLLQLSAFGRRLNSRKPSREPFPLRVRSCRCILLPLQRKRGQPSSPSISSHLPVRPLTHPLAVLHLVESSRMTALRCTARSRSGCLRRVPATSRRRLMTTSSCAQASLAHLRMCTTLTTARTVLW